MLARLFARTEERTITQASVWGDWPGDTPASWSGERVTQATAMQLLTVYGCVRLISDQISTLPVHVYRKVGDVREPLASPDWLTEPVPNMGFTEWCGQVLSSLLLNGNAYLAVTRNESARIVEVIPLDPAVVQVFRLDRSTKAYRVNGALFGGEMLHLKGVMLPGSDVGYSPLEAARQSIGLGLAALKYGGNYFETDGNMPGVIEAPKVMDPTRKKEMAEAWRRKRSKGGRGLPGLLDDGATWKPTGVTNEQAQFLATRQYTAAEIAGQMFLVDPSDLGIPVDGSTLTYANLEQRNVRRVQVTLLPWIVRIEDALSSLLAKPRYVKLSVDGLLRGDMKTRYESYQIGVDSGFLVPNEPRGFEELPPLDGGDDPRVPAAPAVSAA